MLRANYRGIDKLILEIVPATKNIFEEGTTEESYNKVEKTIDSLNLNETQKQPLERRILGYSYPQTAKIISRTLSTTFGMIQKITCKCIN